MTAAVQIIFPDRPLGTQNAVHDVADLRALDSTDVNEMTEVLVASAGFYKYDPSSLATDDGATVIKPTDLTILQAGRWLLVTGYPTLPVLAAAGGAALIGYTQGGTGTVTRTEQARLRDWISVKDFGATGDGVTNDTAFFSAAIAYANARLPENVPAGISQATTIFIPAGRYLITGSLTAITQNGGVIFKGEGPASELVISATGIVFDADPNALDPFDYDVVHTGLSDLSVIYPATPNANAVVFRCRTAQHNFLRNIKFRNVQCLARLGDETVSATSTNTCSAFTLDNCKGTKANIAGNLVELRKGSGLVVTETNSWSVEGVSGAVSDQTSTLATVSGCNAIVSGWGGWDTASIKGVIYGFDRALYVDASSGTAVLNISLTDAVLDWSGTHAIYLHSSAGANVGNITINGCYLVGWDGLGVEGVGTGNLFNIKVLNSRVLGSNDEGIKFSGAGTSFIDVIGNTVLGAQRKGSGNSAIEIGAGVSHFRVMGNDDKTGGYTFAWGPDNGIKIAADLDHYDVGPGNDITGSVANYSLGTNTTTSVNRRVRNNRRATYAGVQTTGLYVAPTSGVTWENLQATTVEIYIKVTSAGACTIVRNGTTVQSEAAGPLRAQFQLDPGETFAWTGDTVAVKFFAKA